MAVSAPIGAQRYTHGNPDCHTHANVAEPRARARAYASSEREAEAILAIGVHAVSPLS